MIINPHPGKFILLGGYDGSGKDTQANRLDMVLRARYPRIKVFRPFPKEPTRGLIGRRTYDILFDRDQEYTLKDGVEGKVKISEFELQRFFIEDRNSFLGSHLTHSESIFESLS